MSIVIKNSQLNDETISALDKLIDVDINASVAFKLMRIIKWMNISFQSLNNQSL